MTYFLKGNYQLLGKTATDQAKKEEGPKSLTERMEEAALAKLGGSVCFVMKSKTLLWMGESSEATS